MDPHTEFMAIDPLTEFMDPITYSVIDDPVALPCCGNIISRQSIIACMFNGPRCPNCRGDLGSWDPKLAPKIRQVANMISSISGSGSLFNSNLGGKAPDWQAELEELQLNGSTDKTRIGQLRITNPTRKYQFRTLMIPVVDVSGSMHGNPQKQTGECIKTMVDLNYNHPHILTSVVEYDTNFKVSHIDITKPRTQNEIRLGGGGGTSFKTAFNGIINVIRHYQGGDQWPLITNIAVIFLTDGEDSECRADMRNTLVDNLRTELQTAIPTGVPYVVHTVGFGVSHDFKFLDKLRFVGSEEGAYRYATAGEDGDALYQKIMGVVQAICDKAATPIQNLHVPTGHGIQLITSPTANSSGKYWVNMTQFRPIGLAEEAITFQLGNDPLTHTVMVTLSGKYTIGLLSEWYTFLIDQIANEVSLLNKQQTTNTNGAHGRKLHLTLLEHRMKAIICRLTGLETLLNRAQTLAQHIKTLGGGGTVDSKQLNDLKFEGQFGGSDSARKAWIPPTHSIGHSISNALNAANNSNVWYGITPANQLRRQVMKATKSYREYGRLLGTSNSCIGNISLLPYDDYVFIAKSVDNVTTLVMAAAVCGRLRIIEDIHTGMEGDAYQYFHSSFNGFNALDMAIACGNWKMVAYLADVMKLTPVSAERACLVAALSGYKITVADVVARGWWKPEDKHIQSAPNGKVVQLLSSLDGNGSRVDPVTAVNNGMVTELAELISAGKCDPQTWRSFLPLISSGKPTSEQLVCLAKLMQAGLLYPNEELVISVTDDNGTRDEIVWPAFIACEKGIMSLFRLLCKQGALDTVEKVNKQNRLGTSLLWISACNKHIDIVCELINMGADVNLANLKGNPPLVPCCQKGSADIVTLLLTAGARLDTYNKNRDGPVLICCRNGQTEILDMLLSHMTPDERREQLATWAEIDGFPPLHAAIELDKVGAAEVCLKHGAQLDWMTDMNNPVIPGANALHLACYYGRINSVKFLINKGLSPLSPTCGTGFLPLHIAIQKGYLDIARLLIAHPTGREALAIRDSDDRLPVYYANISGNEVLKSELFTNHLALALHEVMYSPTPAIESECSQILATYSQSLSVFDSQEITGIRSDRGVSLLSQAILNGNEHLARTLIQLGSSLTDADDYGITPEFWLAYFKHPEYLTPTHDIQMHLNRLVEITKRSLQNKMLLNLTKGIPRMEDIPMDPVTRLESGFMVSGKAIEALAVLANNRDLGIGYSLLGFLEKLRNQKVFPEGRQALDHILWDARVHLVKLCASDNTLHTTSSLEPLHMMSIYLYTANQLIFQKANETLCAWSDDSLWAPYVHALYQGIHLAPRFTGEVYRPIVTAFTPDEYPIGSQLTWNGFSLTTADWKTCADFINRQLSRSKSDSGPGGIVFVIQSNEQGRDISRLSKYPQNREVVFSPGTRFTILRYLIANKIALAQANIRDTTFKMTDLELAKSISGRTPVIIELKAVMP